MGDFLISLISIGVKEEDKDQIREGIDGGVSTDRIMVSGQRGVQLLGLPSDFGRVMSASDSSSVHPHLNLLPDLSLHGSPLAFHQRSNLQQIQQCQIINLPLSFFLLNSTSFNYHISFLLLFSYSLPFDAFLTPIVLVINGKSAHPSTKNIGYIYKLLGIF